MHPAEELMRAMEAEINSLRATRSRQAELLGRARTALAPFASFGEYMESETEGFADEEELSIETENAVLDRFCVGAFRLASSTLDAIRDELGEQ